MRTRKRKLILISFTLLGVLLACRLGASGSDGTQATAQALAQFVAQTATAAGSQGFDPEAAGATAQAEATQISESVAATQAAAQSLDAEAQLATSQAFSSILSIRRPGWIHPPVTLTIDGNLQYDYANDFVGVVAKDFVMSADITWNTEFGTSGCGFVLRSNGDQEALDQYLVIATRGGNGRVVLSTMADGEIVNAKDLYAYGLDPAFEWQNDTTNRLTVVARGEVIEIFTNGTKIGELVVDEPPGPPIYPPEPPEPDNLDDPNVAAAYEEAKAEHQRVVAEIRANHQERVETYEEHGTVYDRGFVAMVALAESGRTECTFDNAWLWIIEE